MNMLFCQPSTPAPSKSKRSNVRSKINQAHKLSSKYGKSLICSKIYNIALIKKHYIAMLHFISLYFVLLENYRNTCITKGISQRYPPNFYKSSKRVLQALKFF